MILLTPKLRAALRLNAQHPATNHHDPAPLVKLFSPMGAATWLGTELHDEDDILFGLGDLGLGCPKLGCFSLCGPASIRLPFGLGIERDVGLAAIAILSVWADTARQTGSISQAQFVIWRSECAPIPELPTDLKQGKADDARRVTPLFKASPPTLKDRRTGTHKE